jgi:hypothetical protein
MSEREIKVEPPIRREFLELKAIRLYPRIERTTYYVNSTIERNERPRFLVKAAFSPKRGDHEIEIVFLGPYHSEREIADYSTKPPEKWTSWGEFVLSPAQAKQFVEILNEMQDAITHHNGTTKQGKIEQTKLVHMTRIFDLSWLAIEPYSTIFDYQEVSRLLSLFGHRKIIAVLKRARANGFSKRRGTR